MHAAFATIPQKIVNIIFDFYWDDVNDYVISCTVVAACVLLNQVVNKDCKDYNIYVMLIVETNGIAVELNQMDLYIFNFEKYYFKTWKECKILKDIYWPF